MKNSKKAEPTPRLTLLADTAGDLMSPNPVSIAAHATVREATAFLIDKGFSAAPVIDNAGRPIGVLSRSDLLVHDREKVDHMAAIPEYYEKSELTAPSGESLRGGFQVENVDCTLVRDIMTPIVFGVTPESSVRKVVDEMLALKVHRLFVVGRDGVLVGVISGLDVLRHLGLSKSPAAGAVLAKV